ncbi:hypothetical protein JYU34_010355 [Plutella xylostella]|uniref:DUF4817 domain-containing protein n=1 Tax=Plutella xylostella TaxID=51655 RepID=A0ABQ7QIR4_PLUXY|nr:hypothetical protein JYU34_010355 [Plutella xylostella]
MHYIYGLCDRNARQAAALYRERYPNARHPDHRIISRLHVALSEGRFPGVDVGRGHEGRQRADGEEEVLAEREADPTTSVRDIERRTGVPKSRFQRILKNITLTMCSVYKHFNQEIMHKELYFAGEC